MSNQLTLDLEGRRLVHERGDAEPAYYQLRQVRGKAVSYGRRFSTLFHDAGADLALDIGKNWSALTWRLLFLCFAELDFREYRLLLLVETAQRLGCRQPGLSTCMAALVDAGVIERRRHPKLRTAWTYRISPNIGWLGSPGAWHAEMRRRATEAARDGDTGERGEASPVATAVAASAVGAAITAVARAVVG